MKKLITLISLVSMMIFAFGCQKAPQGDKQESAATTYTVKMEMTNVSTSSKVHYDLTAFEYNEGGEKLGSHGITMATTGKAATFTANDRSVKVKLYIKMYTDVSSYTEYYWLQQVFYLEKGKNIDVVLANESLIGAKEP